MGALAARGRRLGAALAVALGIAAAGVAALAAWPRPEPLPTLGQLPAFALTSHEGRPFGDRDLRGQVFAASFVFTRCPTICPVIVGRLRSVQAATADLGPALRLVSFSVDPEHDTPEVLAAYARENGADPRRWVFLTGGYEELERTVVDGFKQVLERGPDRAPESILHGSHVVLVDGAGRIRGYYDANDADCAERVARDARRLVEQGGRDQGTVAGR